MQAQASPSTDDGRPVARPRLAAVLCAVRRAALRGVVWIEACAARSGQRRALAELDDRLLRDIGVSRGAAASEVAKPFWRGH